jgi:hypothetical protein
MKKVFYFFLAAALTFNIACSKDDDDNNNNPNLVCDGFFEANNMTEEFTAELAFGVFTGKFEAGSKYDVVISENGNVEINSENEIYLFTAAMITECENAQETNVYYTNAANGLRLILQKENLNYQLVISQEGEVGQATLNKLGPVDLSLLADRAGTYTVTSMSDFATHTRMTVIINADGTVNFDTGVEYAQSDVEAIFDRLSCCDRIHVDLIGGTMNFFWVSPDHTQLDYITYDGNTWYFND